MVVPPALPASLVATDRSFRRARVADSAHGGEAAQSPTSGGRAWLAERSVMPVRTPGEE